MTQQFIQRPDREPAQPDVLQQLEARRREVEAETADERRREGEVQVERLAVAADEEDLQKRIDRLLSSSPEDFVMRFIQTEGQ